MEEEIRALIAKFNERAAEDERMQKELEGVDRSAVVVVTDDKTFRFYLRDKQIQGFEEGDLDEADIRVISDSDTLRALIAGELGPMKAMATRKLQIKASLEDMFRLRKLF
jgi:putative sterol carrier protein